MGRALRAARAGWYSCRPNPRVGCVIAHGERVIAEGAHLRAGGPHAEVVALSMAGAEARGATCYVTLEPCCHRGKTPPCTEALIEAGVTRVVYAATDPNPRVRGQGATRLRNAGIEVADGLLAGAAARLNPGFVKRMETGLPRVRAKIAMSLDGYAALADGRSQWLTSTEARADVQRLRAESGAIMTGIGTVIADDPRLTVRDSIFGIPEQPLRVVLDSNGRMSAGACMLSEAGRTLIYAGTVQGRALESPRPGGADIVQVGRAGAGVDLKAVLRDLGRREVNDVLLEAGPTLLSAMLSEGLVDELIVYIAPRLLGAGGMPAFRLPGIGDLGATPRLEISDVRRTGVDLRATLVPRPIPSP